MATDKKISQLSSGAPAQAGDEYVVARSGANYKLTGSNVAALVAGTANTFSAAQTFSNPASFADGSASAPAVTNTGDTDTGVYFPAANEVAVTTGGTVAAAFNSNGLFFRNRIINGDMRIDQRNAGAAMTINTAAASYFVDRWFAFGQAADGVFTVQRSTTAPTGFTNSVIATVTTADASLGATQLYCVTQYIEGFNTADFGWGTAGALPVTLSFWVRSSVTGTFGGSIRNAAANRSYPFTYVINSANTFEYKTITIPGDTTGTWATDNTSGPQVWFSLGSGSTVSGTAGAWAASNFTSATGATNLMATLNATWYITGVQLETGSVATPFERRPYGTELQLCQRYYWRQTRNGVSTYEDFAMGTSADQTTWLRYAIRYPVQMRANPTFSITAAANQYANLTSAGNITATNVILDSTVTTQLATIGVYSASITTGMSGAFRSSNNTTATFDFSAEL